MKLATDNGNTVAHGLLVYLGYFTILTNVLVALVLSVPLVAPASAAGRWFAKPDVATAAAAAIILVAVGYHVLLRGVWNPVGLQRVADTVLHYMTPALFVVHWWVTVPKDRLRWRSIALWATYPAAYFVYALIRGGLTGLYAYYFLDAGAVGYGQVFINALVLLAAFAAVSALLIMVGRRYGSRVREG